MHHRTISSIAHHYRSGVRISRIAADRGISIEMAVAALVEAGAVKIAHFNRLVGQAKAYRQKRMK
jgi:hypothetical protein